jgi:hypothetical protein
MVSAMKTVKCVTCKKRLRHYAAGQCERCWRTGYSRRYYAGLSRKRKAKRIRQITEARARRKAAQA